MKKLVLLSFILPMALAIFANNFYITLTNGLTLASVLRNSVVSGRGNIIFLAPVDRSRYPNGYTGNGFEGVITSKIFTLTTGVAPGKAIITATLPPSRFILKLTASATADTTSINGIHFRKGPHTYVTAIDAQDIVQNLEIKECEFEKLEGLKGAIAVQTGANDPAGQEIVIKKCDFIDNFPSGIASTSTINVRLNATSILEVNGCVFKNSAKGDINVLGNNSDIGVVRV